MSSITFICEGPSEKNLVEKVLQPYWNDKGIPITGNVIIIGEGNPFCGGTGGDVTFNRLKIDLSLAMQNDASSYYTTIFDFYELHGAWPGQNEIKPEMVSINKVHTIEQATRNALIAQYAALPIAAQFIPYFMLHEYEGLLFTDPAAITAVTKARQSQAALEAILTGFKFHPEEINTADAPSKRLQNAKASYGKTRHAHRIMNKIGVDKVRDMCPHFDEWLKRLENLALKNSGNKNPLD